MKDTITGSLDELRTTLTGLHRSQELVEFSQPYPVPGRHAGRELYAVRVRLKTPTKPRRRRWVYIAAGTAAAVTLAAAVWAVIWTLAWVAAHWQIIAAAGVLLALLALPAGKAACEGLHCGGCKR